MFLKYFLGVFLRIREKLLRSMREGYGPVIFFALDRNRINVR
jgi:hypothetical protein